MAKAQSINFMDISGSMVSTESKPMFLNDHDITELHKLIK